MSVNFLNPATEVRYQKFCEAHYVRTSTQGKWGLVICEMMILDMDVGIPIPVLSRRTIGNLYRLNKNNNSLLRPF